MTAPRLEIDLDKIRHNASTLVGSLGERGISVTGVTKATLGSPEIARVLTSAGVTGIGDSRIENIRAMRLALPATAMTLIRAPMHSQVELVVAAADVSFNSELSTLRLLSAAAERQGRTHGYVVMIELGDLREGVLPNELEQFVREALRLPGLSLRGVGTNLACQSGVVPDRDNMAELSSLACTIEATFGISLDLVSGGNSANLAWALSDEAKGRINDLRLGESILLGRETLHREALPGLHTDAITLVAEVIESRRKPSIPRGAIAEAAFGVPPATRDRGAMWRTILALGEQDVDPGGLLPPSGMEVIGASSDHLILAADAAAPAVGSEVSFQLTYSALLRAMTSPFVERRIAPDPRATGPAAPPWPRPDARVSR